MSKFTDKLDRLHASRVRALEADEGSDGKRVFVAEVDTVAKPPVVAKEESPAREAVRSQLETAERLGLRTRRPRVTMARAEEPEAAATPTRVARVPASSDNAVGERLGELRLRAEALIAVGGLESALPLLHEMAALSPTHPFPLTQLAEYWRRQGDMRLSALYAGRLSSIAPY